VPQLLPTGTSRDEAEREARVAVLPVGSYEQHGDYLPLATDTMVACLIAADVAAAYNLMLLPPVTISCSHEHAAWAGTVSISSSTLHAIISDVAASLLARGIERLLVVNGHGGNYVLSNAVQEASVKGAVMALFPRTEDWRDARQVAGMETDSHADMHAGELETSLLLHAMPEVVRPGYESADHDADDRRHLLSDGMKRYTSSGVIGRPSLATADKGKAALAELTRLAGAHIDALLAD
jgi:creatinine amidohydrolase